MKFKKDTVVILKLMYQIICRKHLEVVMILVSIVVLIKICFYVDTDN